MIRRLLARAAAWLLHRPDAHDTPDEYIWPGLSWPDPPPSWPTPTPAHVLERQAPLRGEDTRTVRPYVTAEETLEIPIVRERRQAAAAASAGLP